MLIFVWFTAVKVVPVGKRPLPELATGESGEVAKRVRLDGPSDTLSLAA